MQAAGRNLAREGFVGRTPGRRRRRAGGLALVLLGLCVVLVGLPLKPGRPPGDLHRRAPRQIRTARAQPDPELVGRVWSVLLPPARRREPTVEELGRELAALGPRAARVLVAIACGECLEPVEEDLAVHPLAVDRRREILVAGLKRLPRAIVVDALRELRAPDLPLQERLAALGLAGELGEARELRLLLELAASFTHSQLRQVPVHAPIEEALAAVLGRDPAAFGELGAVLDELEPKLWPLAVRALGKTGSHRAPPILARCFGRSPALDQALLDVLPGAGAPMDPEVWDELAERVRRCLEDFDPRIRAAAAAAAGALVDPQACDRLVAMLDDEDTEAASAALASLERISTLSLGRDRAAWLAWCELERDWYEGESARLVEELASADAGSAVSAIESLLRHPAYLHRCAQDIESLLGSDNPDVARAACAALVQLGSRRPVPALVAALRTSDESLRGQFGAALRELTGLELGDQPDAWESELGL